VTEPQGRLDTLVEASRQLGVERLATEASELRERLREGRFFVACVGQFKRGKSTLLNALVGAEVLPIGVVPVTAIVTVLRYGDNARARVRSSAGEWKAIELREVREYAGRLAATRSSGRAGPRCSRCATATA
jgi:hypothetical protein